MYPDKLRDLYLTRLLQRARYKSITERIFIMTSIISGANNSMPTPLPVTAAIRRDDERLRASLTEEKCVLKNLWHNFPSN